MKFEIEDFLTASSCLTMKYWTCHVIDLRHFVCVLDIQVWESVPYFGGFRRIFPSRLKSNFQLANNHQIKIKKLKKKKKKKKGILDLWRVWEFPRDWKWRYATMQYLREKETDTCMEPSKVDNYLLHYLMSNMDLAQSDKM